MIPKKFEDEEKEAIRSFMRSCNHWFHLLPNEEAMFADAAYRGSNQERVHSVELLAALFNEDNPHHLAMIAQEAYRGIHAETNLRNDIKTEIQQKIEPVWEDHAKGHTFPKDAVVLTYLPWEFRAAIDYRNHVDEETFDAMCFGLYLNWETDYLCIGDCFAEISDRREYLDELDFNGLQKELKKIEAAIKNIVGTSPERYYWNYCRNRNRFDRRLINLFHERKDVLNRMVLSTEEEKQRFRAVDDLLRELTKKMYKRTANLYRSTIANGDEAYDYNVDGWVSYYIDFPDDEFATQLLDTDKLYGSEFKYMMMCAYNQQALASRERMSMQIVSCMIGAQKEHNPEISDEELGMVDPFDNRDWTATHYSNHPLSDQKICYATHCLLTDSLLSIPDILRISWFEVESQITSQYVKSPAHAPLS